MVKSMGGYRGYKLPERCCLFCRFGTVKSGGMVFCTCEDSYYFENYMAKKDHCPDFRKEANEERNDKRRV